MVMVKGLVKRGLCHVLFQKHTKLLKDLSQGDKVKEIKKLRNVKRESRSAGLHHGKKWRRGKR